jgi:hypothetical protein
MEQLRAPALHKRTKAVSIEPHLQIRQSMNAECDRVRQWAEGDQQILDRIESGIAK